MKVLPSDLPGVFIVEPALHRDGRGYFFEAYRADTFRAHGIADTFVQENQSRSLAGTLRGLHLQRPPKAQGKLVRVVDGEIFDVAADIPARRIADTNGPAQVFS